MRNIPVVTRTLILVNVICFLLQLVLGGRGIDVSNFLGLHFVLADAFNPLQLVTYMFLHGGFTHLFFNMFSLWMFGGIIERTLGARRYLLYYLLTGVGAGLFQELFQTGQYFVMMPDLLIENLTGSIPAAGTEVYNLWVEQFVQTDQYRALCGEFLNQWTTIGASGACYGVLLAFGMLYPNERLMLLFPPIPMKAKYFVAGYAAIELFSAFATNGNVAHFAHLGGMFFGWLWLRHWQRKAARGTNNGWERWDTPARPSWTARVRESLAKAFRGRQTTAGNAHRAPQRETDYEYNMRKKQEEARMDEILDKVRKGGYDSLTAEEKRELFRISHR